MAELLSAISLTSNTAGAPTLAAALLQICVASQCRDCVCLCEDKVVKAMIAREEGPHESRTAAVSGDFLQTRCIFPIAALSRSSLDLLLLCATAVPC